jgi:hypothetical protein
MSAATLIVLVLMLSDACCESLCLLAEMPCCAMVRGMQTLIDYGLLLSQCK